MFTLHTPSFLSKVLRQAVAVVLFFLLCAVGTLQAQTIDGDTPVLDGDTLDAAYDPALEDSTLMWPFNVQQRLDRLTADPMFRLSQLGLYVYDLTADSALYDKGSEQLLRPASCQKLLTAITALARLGASYRFQTSLYRSGTVADSVLHGDLYVVGGFDPAFGRDDLRAFVRSLLEQGIYHIEGNLATDLSFKDTLRWGEGWCWDDGYERLTPLMYQKKDVFVEHMLELMKSEGVEAEGGVTTQRLPGSGTQLLVRRTHTMDQILQRMMKESDNIYAEAMFYQLGAGTPWAGGKQSAREVLRLIGETGEDPSRSRVADGSGLSLYNYTTARTLVAALRYAYLRNNIYLHLYPSLPVAGVDGTLRRRMRSGAAYNNVHAKTGTVEGVSSLSGYLTAANGHVLAFSIINQGILHTRNGHRFQDRVCQALANP